MSYLTESKLSSIVDIPVSMPATEIKQGDWLMISSIKLVQPATLTVRFASLQLLACNLDITRVGLTNFVYGNLGYVYLALRKDYIGDNPGASGALDVLAATNIGIYSRNMLAPLTLTTPGVYSWFIVNNMKADASSAVPTSTSIDFRVCVTGQARLDIGN